MFIEERSRSANSSYLNDLRVLLSDSWECLFRGLVNLHGYDYHYHRAMQFRQARRQSFDNLSETHKRGFEFAQFNDDGQGWEAWFWGGRYLKVVRLIENQDLRASAKLQ